MSCIRDAALGKLWQSPLRAKLSKMCFAVSGQKPRGLYSAMSSLNDGLIIFLAIGLTDFFRFSKVCSFSILFIAMGIADIELLACSYTGIGISDLEMIARS